MSLLELYRNDSRYYYDNDDIHGSLGVTSEYFESDQMEEKDQILLEHFSFSYDTEQNRYVGAFLRYLRTLSPEHQKIWYSKMVSVETFLHPEYLRSASGLWPETVPIFSAFLEEQLIINELCKNIGKPIFFRKTFSYQEKPREFSFLIRPTLKEFNDFILLLDKMMSDNINKKFFKGEIPDEDEEERSDGKIIVRKRGTIRLLDEWLKVHFIASDQESKETITQMLSTVKRVRRLRQSPAHGIKENIFDNKYIHEQRKIMKSAYLAMKTIRLILQNHPLAGNVNISEALEKGKISSF